MKRTWIICLAVLAAGCGPKVITEVRIEKVYVKVPVACPAKGDYDTLKATRPRALRETEQPATAEERVAKTSAQLGRFEAEGAWADKVEAALDRCQTEKVASPP